MTIFEYFLVLFSVVLSLGLAQLATGIGELARYPGRVRWSLPHALWVLWVFGTIIDLWGSTWLMREAMSFSLFSILLAVMTAIATYLAALWVVPRTQESGDIDLYAFMVAERRRFIGAMIAYVVCGVVWNLYLLPPGHFDLANYFIAAPMLVAMTVGWWTPNRWVQHIVPVIGVISIIIYFAIYFPTIG